MILANITFAVSPDADSTFRVWAKDIFIKNATEKGRFTSPLFCRILAGDDDSATSYAVQMLCGSESEAREWYESGNGAMMLRNLMHKTGDKVLWFITFMEVVE